MILDKEDMLQRQVFGDHGFYNQRTLLSDLCNAICVLEDDYGKFAVFICDSHNLNLTEETKAIVFPNKIEFLIWEQSMLGDIDKAIESINNEPKL